MEANYKLINNCYYYTEELTGKNFKYEDNNWLELEDKDVPTELLTTAVDKPVNEQGDSVTVDEEGRRYYQAEGYSLCQNADGSVYFLNEHHQWEIWNAKSKNEERWYFYKGNDKLYRDAESGKLYKLNRVSNEYEETKEINSRRKLANEDEEFDSDEEENYDHMEVDETSNDNRPLGADTDPNISFDGKVYNKIDFTDGTTYEWDVQKRAWIPKIDDDFMAKYQMNYGFNPDGSKDENPQKFDDDTEHQEEEEKTQKVDKEEGKKIASWFEVDDSHNNKVYVTNLPLDITENEFVDFMQKCGLVLKDSETNKFKIKMYKSADGNFKGDAICTYIKVESVELALQILHEYTLQGKKIGVERAKFTQKGEYNASFKPRKRRKRDLDKVKKKQEKLFAWAPDPVRGERAKHENVIILGNVFITSEFETGAERILEHQERIRTCCQVFGSVKKVEVFDRHPEGIVKVTFEDIDSADMCVSTLNNRLYGKRTLTAITWNGKDKYRIEETEEQKQERIKKWESFLNSNKPI